MRVLLPWTNGSKDDPKGVIRGAYLVARGVKRPNPGLDPRIAADGPTLHRITRRCTHALTRYAYAHVGA